MSEEKSSGKLGIILVALLAATASYFTVGIQNQFGYLMMGMIGLTFLLGITGKIKSGTATFTLIVLLVLGAGSPFIEQMGYPTYAFAARAISLVLFVFIAISAIGALLKILLSIGGVVLLVFAIGYVLKSKTLQKVSKQDNAGLTYTEKDKTAVKDSDQEIKIDEKPNDVLVSHTRSWRDLRFNTYSTKLEVWESDYHVSSENRKDIKIRNARNSMQYWRQIYDKLVKHDADHIDRILETFITIGKEKKLNTLAFAQMVVSCVQNIPYVLIYTDPCESIGSDQTSLQELIAEHPCKGPVKYGLQSPAEFVYTLEGDCDTRTVFLFTVLSRLGYKVSILNSDIYGHSMFGLAVPASGTYKGYRGEHYYFWETTAKGWDIGTLPPEMGEVDNWEVVLAN